ncbi:MAG: hypothetical protein IPJ01_06250 [Micavibrio sp.]|nr:hypothetical protein [Micavibrio sp.]MBK9562731.1 hypothetical protein [Micavibrio sp.]
MDAIIAVGDAKAKQMPKHRQVDVFQEEVTWTLRDGYKRKTKSIHMIETDIPRYGRDDIGHERSTKKAPHSSLLVRAAFAPFKLTWSGMRKLSGLFGRAADDRNHIANDWNSAQDNRPLITSTQQPAGSDVKPQTHDRLVRSVDALFSSGADKESENVSLPLAGSKAERNVDGLGLKAGDANVHTNKRGFSLSSFYRTNVRKVADETNLRPQSLTFRENVRLDREP